MAPKDPFSVLSPQAEHELKKERMPTWVNPMLATLTDNYFSKPTWIYEHKWDGERILAYKIGNSVKLFTRNKKSATAIYPDIVHALEKQPQKNFIIDGEVVAFKHKTKRSDFSMLQNIMHSEKAHAGLHLDYCIFDIIHLNGYNTRAVPLIERKALLLAALQYKGPLLYTEHIVKDGIKYFHAACKKKWEGVIAKDGQSEYVSVRSRAWLKFKCINQQELVIGGYTSPQGTRINFGALLVGYYKDGKLMYAGKVGTGYNTEILRDLGKQLFALEQDTCPFANFDGSTKDIHWVKPKLVAEIKFSEWTPYNKLRHPVFMGLREDKAAREVIQEKPKSRVL